MYDLTSNLRPESISNEDFESFKRDIGVTEDELWEARMKLIAPEPSDKESGVYFAPSEIHGNGVMINQDTSMSEFIAPLFMDGKFTLTGMMINHSDSPNCKIREYRGDLWLQASHSIAEGTELTVNYREVG